MKVLIVLLAAAVCCCMAASVPIVPAASIGGNLDMATGRIISGYPAGHNQFPYQVLITSVASTGPTEVCGGSLVSTVWILSAAHCTVDTNRRYNLRMGSINFSSGGTSSTTNRVHNHPEFDPITMNNDLSLVHQPRLIQISDGMRPTRLPAAWEQTYTFTGRTGFLTGWGAVANGGAMQPALRYANMVVVAKEECAKHYDAASIVDTVLCVRGRHSNEGPCDGDFGGPLVLQQSDGLNQIGVASMGGAGDCSSGKPAVFTRVGAYLVWIREVANIAIRMR